MTLFICFFLLLIYTAAGLETGTVLVDPFSGTDATPTFSTPTVTVNKLQNELFGAEVIGLDVENITSSELIWFELLLVQYKVIVVRRQAALTVEGLRRFTRHFGALHEHLESRSHLPGYRDVNVVSNIRDKTGLMTGLYGAHVENYHSDLSWSHLPCKVTILKSVIRPDDCGDTHFIDSSAAYIDLSDEIKSKLEGLQGKYCYLKTRRIDVETGLTEAQIDAASSCATHPLITRHPVTGAKNIYANPSHTKSIVGYSDVSSEELLRLLFNHSEREKYFYSHKWMDDDLVIWDNRAVQHRASGCPESRPRKLIRTTVLNDEPPRE